MFAGLVLMAGCAAMPGPPTSGTADDTSWMFHDIVDASFVASHLAVPMPENVLLIDSRPYRGKYVKGHIPGAISIPFTEFDKKTGLLPEDKNVLLIFTVKARHAGSAINQPERHKTLDIPISRFIPRVFLNGSA